MHQQRQARSFVRKTFQRKRSAEKDASTTPSKVICEEKHLKERDLLKKMHQQRQARSFVRKTFQRKRSAEKDASTTPSKVICEENISKRKTFHQKVRKTFQRKRSAEKMHQQRQARSFVRKTFQRKRSAEKMHQQRQARSFVRKTFQRKRSAEKDASTTPSKVICEENISKNKLRTCLPISQIVGWGKSKRTILKKGLKCRILGLEPEAVLIPGASPELQEIINLTIQWYLVPDYSPLWFLKRLFKLLMRMKWFRWSQLVRTSQFWSQLVLEVAFGATVLYGMDSVGGSSRLVPRVDNVLLASREGNDVFEDDGTTEYTVEQVDDEVSAAPHYLT
ncbi:unnamed protein product [Mytilus coruscus]|uniref:Uncharacterized protein n=1 Tax=Mytilus coruscus TaxID=42192 RepID=A0A6J8BPD5_MYTCO|nr:unnamed protein product [Mytilus coruscus]